MSETEGERERENEGGERDRVKERGREGLAERKI